MTGEKNFPRNLAEPRDVIRRARPSSGPSATFSLFAQISQVEATPHHTRSARLRDVARAFTRRNARLATRRDRSTRATDRSRAMPATTSRRAAARAPAGKSSTASESTARATRHRGSEPAASRRSTRNSSAKNDLEDAPNAPEEAVEARDAPATATARVSASAREVRFSSASATFRASSPPRIDARVGAHATSRARTTTRSRRGRAAGTLRRVESLGDAGRGTPPRVPGARERARLSSKRCPRGTRAKYLRRASTAVFDEIFHFHSTD